MAWYCTNTDRYDIAPGSGCDPLGDLALEHEHEVLGPRRRPEQPVEHGARDVVRQVGDDVVRRRHEVDEVLVERVALDETEPLLVDLAGERVPQEGRQARVELDGRDGRPGREEAAREEAEPGPDLEHAATRGRIRLAQDPLEDVDVGEEVLARPCLGRRPAVWRVRRT